MGHMCLSAPITQGKGRGPSLDHPPANNSNNGSYKMYKKYKPQQGKVDNRPPHMDSMAVAAKMDKKKKLHILSKYE